MDPGEAYRPKFLAFRQPLEEAVLDRLSVNDPRPHAKQGMDARPVRLDGRDKPHLVHLVEDPGNSLSVTPPQAGQFHLGSDELADLDGGSEASFLVGLFLRLGEVNQ